jgi:hypothetical protein
MFYTGAYTYSAVYGTVKAFVCNLQVYCRQREHIPSVSLFEEA